MKKKTFHKLSLSKTTITNLAVRQKQAAKGGAIIPPDLPTFSTCTCFDSCRPWQCFEPEFTLQISECGECFTMPTGCTDCTVCYPCVW